MPRFFKRLSEGVFDEEDLIFRTIELYDFLDEAAGKYEFDRDNIYAIGYSNGANIEERLLFYFKDALEGAMLHHLIVPRLGIELPDLSGKSVFIAAGTNDPICSPKESEDLENIVKEAGADTQIHWENNGHQLSLQEVETAGNWYASL